MVTLIAAYGSGGESLGRCDAHCYEALTFECTCICRGKNHGAGLNRATSNTARFAQDWLKGLGHQHATIFGEESGQMDIFGKP